METFKFVWKIENFNFLPPLRGKALKSPQFNINFVGSTFLELYPKGDILDADRESIIICLNNCNKLPHTSVYCDVLLVQGEQTTEFKKEKVHESTKWRFKREKECRRFFPKEKISEEFTKATLTVTCHFSQTESARSSRMENAVESDMLLLSHQIQEMYHDHLFSDVTLCAGKDRFPVHKAILFVRVPQLVNDIERETSYLTPFERKVTDMEPEVLKVLLNYAYTGKIDVSTSDIPSGLYSVADTYELNDLRQKLHSYPNEVVARTCIKVDRNIFMWPIKNLKNLELDKKYYSPSFTGGVINGSDLKLVCYLARNDKEEDTLEICIQRVIPSKENPIFVRCKITIVDLSVCTRAAEHVFMADEEWHFPSFIPIIVRDEHVYISSHLGLKPSHLEHTGVTLRCEFYISGGETSTIEETECVSTRYENFARGGEDVRNLCSDLGSLYNIFLPKISDVTLRVGEIRFPAHKAILAARSPVFARMFDNDMVERNSGVVTITDTEFAILNMMLTFMYSAKVEILSYETAMKLFTAADKYEVDSLKVRCINYMKLAMCVDNVCDMYVLADMHGDKDLKACAKDFIFAHADVVLETDDWKGLLETRPDLASEVLHSLVSIVLCHNRECNICERSKVG